MEQATVPLSKLIDLTPSLATKLSILHAVDEPLATMSVENICRKCGVSRQTFYHHFKSKYDIVFWFSDLCQTFYLDDIGRCYTWLEGYSKHYTLLYSEREFLAYTVAKKPIQTNHYDLQRKHEHRKKTLIQTLVNFHGAELTDLLLFQVSSFVFTESEMTRRWFVEGLSKSPKTFAREMDSVVPQQLYRLLNGGVTQAM